MYRCPDIRLSLQEIDGVENVHDLHVWCLGSQTRALATHVTVADIPTSETSRILTEINTTLRTRFRIHHTTIQFENADCEVAHGCAMPVETVSAHSHSHGHDHAGHSR